MSKHKKPQIRFKGFSEDWEERYLGEIPKDTFGGGTPSTTMAVYWNGDIPWIQSSDLIEHEIQNVVIRKHITKIAIKHSAVKLIPENSIAIVTRVGVGKVALVNQQYSTSQDFISLSNIIDDLMFVVYSIYRKLQNVLHEVQGTSIKGITKDELLQKAIVLPDCRAEQTAIGEFFKNLDRLITLNECKYDKLVNVKKAMLEKMFPKDGADIPEVRFRGFSGAWERKKLGIEVADIIGGGTPSTAILEYWNGNIDWYSPTEIGEKVYANNSVKKITELGLKNSSAQMLPANSTILFTSRAGIGDMAILVRDGATNQGFQSLVLKKGFDTYFVYSMGHLIKRYAEKYSSGSTFLEISGKILGKMELYTPSENEQTAIGEFFKNLDRLILLQKQKIEKLKNIKKACLEKMFI